MCTKYPNLCLNDTVFPKMFCTKCEKSSTFKSWASKTNDWILCCLDIIGSEIHPIWGQARTVLLPTGDYVWGLCLIQRSLEFLDSKGISNVYCCTGMKSEYSVAFHRGERADHVKQLHMPAKYICKNMNLFSLALNRNLRPRQCQDITFHLDPAPDSTFSFTAEHSGRQIVCMYLSW